MPTLENRLSWLLGGIYTIFHTSLPLSHEIKNNFLLGKEYYLHQLKT